MLTHSTEAQIRAFHTLQGIAVGDALGAYFEFTSGRVPARILERQPPSPPWHWTDDTHMAWATYATLQEYGSINQNALAQKLATNYQRSRGYGPTTRMILSRVRKGHTWQTVSQSVFNGMGSYGNGSMARAAVVGAYFADNLEKAIEQTRQSTEVVHTHPEAIAGGIAVATAAVLAYQRPQKHLSVHTFLGMLIPHVPTSEVRDKLLTAQNLPSETSSAEAAQILGNGTNVSAQDTVPFALWCAAVKMPDFEETVWFTLSGLGDCDTTCAIASGIAVCATGVKAIPQNWLEACEPLPENHPTS